MKQRTQTFLRSIVTVLAGTLFVLAFRAEAAALPAPRSEGRVILAGPGSPADQKAYAEPGGGFSPAPGSFGISFWVVDPRGGRITTSDTLPLNLITQRWVRLTQPVWAPAAILPSVEYSTPYYRSRWSALQPGRHQLNLRTFNLEDVWIVVRGPGPAGGVLHDLVKTFDGLFLNDRWRLALKGPVARAEVVSPRVPVEPNVPVTWKSEATRGYAMYRLNRGQEYVLTIEDTRPGLVADWTVYDTRPGVRVSVPDVRFSECLEAQVAQLLMGLTGDETRPADPMQVTVASHREAAAIVTALARAGCLEAALRLCPRLATEDFSGAFGAEADAPGLALWALEEVAARAGSTDYDFSLWPHVERKVGLIVEMMETRGSIWMTLANPQTASEDAAPKPQALCHASDKGLIVGRVEDGFPSVYVNAVSHLGLRAAVRVALRLGKAEAARDWSRRADSLAEALLASAGTVPAGNPYQYSEGISVFRLRPVAGPVCEPLSDEAGREIGRMLAPQREALAMAVTRQAILLGRAVDTWAGLEGFWARQSAPGLYAWAAPLSAYPVRSRWSDLPGSPKPGEIAPDYWAAAQMLLLQLEMLVQAEEVDGVVRMTIGPGVPRNWLESELRVEGFATPWGPVDWSWRKGRLEVRLKGEGLAKAQVVTGPAFPVDAEVRIGL